MRRLLASLALATALLASCGSAGEGSGHVRGDTAAPADTAARSDTAAPVDTAARSDTAVPGHTAGTAQPDKATVDWPLTYSGATVAGRQFDPGDYAGQDLLLWFWAPW